MHICSQQQPAFLLEYTHVLWSYCQKQKIHLDSLALHCFMYVFFDHNASLQSLSSLTRD